MTFQYSWLRHNFIQKAHFDRMKKLDMRAFSQIIKSAFVGFLVMASASCSGLNLGTASLLHNLDFLRDDVANMIFVVDAPLALLPQDDGIVFEIDATTATFGDHHIRAVLERGSDFSTLSNLPPPANNRTYHLFVFSEVDQQKIREFQKWAIELQEIYGAADGELQLAVKPAFCRTTPEDVSNESISVLISLPDQSALNPLISNVKLSSITQNANNLPICVQT